MTTSYTVIQLRKICKENGIKGYSKLKKDELMKICFPVNNEIIPETKEESKEEVQEQPTEEVQEQPTEEVQQENFENIILKEVHRSRITRIVNNITRCKKADVTKLTNYIFKFINKNGFNNLNVEILEPLIIKAKVDIIPEKLYKILINIICKNKITANYVYDTDKLITVLEEIMERPEIKSYEVSDLHGFMQKTNDKDRKQFLKNRSKGRKSWRLLSVDDLEPMMNIINEVRLHPKMSYYFNTDNHFEIDIF